MPEDRMWPSVPVELRYVDLRLPGTFRELVANKSFTNEEVGKIVRCLALDTDFFVTQKIEAEVLYYLAKLRKNNRSRMRMEAMRNRRKAAEDAARKKPASTAQSVTNRVTVTPTVVEDPSVADASGGDSSSIQKTPSIIIEKTPPIIPLEKKPSSSLENGAARTRKRGKTKGAREDLQDDLFALATASCIGGVAKESPRTGAGSPVARPEVLDGKTTVQDIESAPGGSTARIDTREDAAWIPERFAAFWRQYPKKVAKADALKAFTKLIKAQPDVDKFMAKTLASLEWWKGQSSWTKDGGKFIPYPATWLNRGHWGDCGENSEVSGKPEFLRADPESDEELIKRMQGG